MFNKNQWLLLKRIGIIAINLIFSLKFCFANEVSNIESESQFTTELIATLLSTLRPNNDSIKAERLSNSNKSIKIGYLTNISGRQNQLRQGIVISGAITYAINRINSNTSILNGRQLELVFNDTKGLTVDGTAALLDQWRVGVVAFFGPEDSCEVEATIAAALKLPMISYKCADSKVSQKDLYPTFARTHPPDTAIVRSVIALLSYFHWNKFSIIWENTPQCRTVFKSLTDQAIAQDFIINSEKSFENYYECCEQKSSCCRSTFLNIVEETYRGTRVYVFLGKTSDLHRLMLVLRMRGMFEKGEYIVIYVDLEEDYQISQSNKYINTRPDISEDEKRALDESAQSLLVIAPNPPNGTDYSDFEDKVREFNAKAPFNLWDPVDPLKNTKWKRHITIYASYLYDSVVLYCDALSQVLREGLTENDGKAIIRKIIERKRYLSVTGAYMNIDENGDVEGNYTVLARMPTPPGLQVKGMSGSQRPAYVMLPVGNFEYEELMNRTVFKLEGYINWVSDEPPLVEPPCGFDGSGCLETTDHKKEVIAGVLMGVFVTIAIITAVTYRNWKYEQEIAGLLWKINLVDLELDPGAHPMFASQMSITSQASEQSRLHTQVFTQIATYRGAYVALKQLKVIRKTFDISRNVKKEMKTMKELSHDNINKFIGAYIEPCAVFIVTEYCAKGSLYDILENEDMKLDAMFQTSLVFDLISGMIFLHDSDIRFHGNLKSSNCVVTSRWVLQITDFGLHQLRANSQTESSADEENKYRNMLWKSPELLRSGVIGGNQKSDVYAFAIILHEIIAREGPFGINLDDYLTCKEIVHKVKDCAQSQPFRPDICLVQSQDYVLQTMQECWSELPDERPDFRTVRSKLKKLRQGFKHNIMDNMIAMLEKYANNLEEIVDERTAQLSEEKKKTEALLDRMLPRTVAAQLMRGESVIPESYDAVTIFFSDIVGFTSMSASSTPMEVVTFLNDLYTLFDSIICNYEIYKVETIGDAYMVVSGLPIRNGDNHAAEIASMALELLESVKTFRIRHRQEDILQLRIGIHTGPVVAGVVGRTMPRYCLFGDTVNTASRMESNGEALKIHISPQCRDYLVKLGGYVILERGFVSMKGKGQVLTYWLESHTKGQMHRRESVPDDFLQVPNFTYSSNDKKRSAISPTACVLPRKGSLLGFKGNRSDGSNANLSNARLPAFLRLKAHDSNGSIRTNSPKPSKKIIPLRQSRLLLRDQMSDKEDINHSNDSQIHSKPLPKNSSNFMIKSSERLNTLNENSFFDTNVNHNDIKHNSSLTPLLGDHNLNGTNQFSNDLNFLVDLSFSDEKESRVPLLSSLSKINNIVISKKWNSCTELAFNKSLANNSSAEKSYKSNNNSINANPIDPTVKDWSKISLIDSNHIITDPIIREKTTELTNGLKRRPSSNYDFVIKSLNDCELKVESSV